MKETSRPWKGILLLLLCACVAVGLIWAEYRERQSSRTEVCLLALDDAKRFFYQEVSYTILDETLDRAGAQVGAIDRYAVLDGDRAILRQREKSGAGPSDLAQGLEDRACSVHTYGKVYQPPEGEEGFLCVEFDGALRRAVPTDSLSFS